MIRRLEGVEPLGLAEGGVLAGLDVAVVLGEGGHEVVDRHVHGNSEVLDGVGGTVHVLMDVDVVLDGGAHAAVVEGALVEDDPPLAVAAVQACLGGVVGLALLDEALAVGQDEHHGRPVAPGGGVGQVAHQVAVVVGDGGVHADLLGAGGPSHGVALAHAAAVDENAVVSPLGQVGVHHLAVVDEAAGGQNDGVGLDVDVGAVLVMEAAADDGAVGGILDEGDSAEVVLELGAELLELGLDGRKDVLVARGDTLAGQHDGGTELGQLLHGAGLEEVAAEVLGSAVEELGGSEVLALGILGPPVEVERGGLPLLGSLPSLLDGGLRAMLELVLRAGGEHEPTGGGRVAAEGTLLLGEDDLLAGEGGLHAGGQAGDAGADNQDVGLLGERDVGRTDQIAGFVGHSSAGTNRSASNQASSATELDEIPASNLHKNIPFRLTPYGCAPHARHGAIPALPLCASASRCDAWRPAPWRYPTRRFQCTRIRAQDATPKIGQMGDGVAYGLVDKVG